MSSDSKVFDLDTFFHGEDLELVNFAAQLMTERSEADDSMWSGSPYGSVVESLLPRPGAQELVRREILRVMEVVGLKGDVTVTEDTDARIRLADIDLTVTSAGVST
jgi:hypothetical protein